MKASFSLRRAIPPPTGLLWVIFFMFIGNQVSAQLIDPGYVEFQHGPNDPSGFHRIDVIWSGFVIPADDPNINYSMHVRVNLTTNGLVNPCVNETLTEASKHPAFTTGAVDVSFTSVSLSVNDIGALGLNGLEQPLTLFSIYYVGNPGSYVIFNWEQLSTAPRIYAVIGGAVQAWYMGLSASAFRFFPSKTITGSIYKPSFTQDNCSSGSNAAVTQVIVNKTVNETCSPTLLNTTVTNQNNGNYSFTVNQFFDYTISPVKTNNRACGVNGLDITFVQQHILWNDLLDYPYQVVAGDMNLDRTLTTGEDLVEIQRLILGTFTPPTGWNSWTFPPTAVYGVFPPITDNLYVHPAFVESIQINDLTDNAAIQDFVGIKRGDVDGSCTACNNLPLKGEEGEDRSLAQDRIVINDRAIRAGETVQLPVYLNDWELGYNVVSFALEFSPDYFEVLTVRDGQLPHLNENCFNWDAMQDGLVRHCWVNYDREETHRTKEDALFYVMLEAKQPVQSLRELIKIRHDIQDCSIVTTELEQKFLDMEIAGMTDDRDDVQAYPNPFDREFVIAIDAEESGEAQIEVVNADGKTVYRVRHYLEQGHQTVSMPVMDVPSGIFCYRVITSGREYNGKVVKR